MQLYPVVFTIVVINLLLWVIIDLLQLEIGQVIEFYGIGWNLAIAFGEYWRLVTPIFLHADITHVLFNSFALVLFGPALEQMVGKFRFILGYLGAGIIGNIGTYIIQPLDYVHLGASGAIYGLFGIYIFMILFRKHLIDYGSSQMIITIVVIGVLMSFVGARINLTAHFAGFAGGFILAPLLLRNIRPFSPWRSYQRKYPEDDGEVHFDPNRWSKKKKVPNFIRKNWLWLVIAVLAIFAIINRM